MKALPEMREFTASDGSRFYCYEQSEAEAMAKAGREAFDRTEAAAEDRAARDRHNRNQAVSAAVAAKGVAMETKEFEINGFIIRAQDKAQATDLAKQLEGASPALQAKFRKPVMSTREVYALREAQYRGEASPNPQAGSQDRISSPDEIYAHREAQVRAAWGQPKEARR